MALIGRMITRRLGPLLGDTDEHQRHQSQYHPQDQFHNPVSYQYGHQNTHNGPCNCQQPSMNSGCSHLHNPPVQPVFVGRKAERHYRKAERTMQRAEHKAERNIRRAERDMRRAERRGEVVFSAPVVHSAGYGVGPQNYSRQNNHYEMRDMNYQRPQSQGNYTPGLDGQDSRRAGQSRRLSEDVPPPAYEEIDKKQ
ncbi:hypothetical protein BGZ63DRAFT_399094 [Mariannaea sp. PMI_226]|nr:hypothetical protein BGZ63DRAFT_399094 [Mariannaea sp. PMI_226]